jgi:putative membrane protein
MTLASMLIFLVALLHAYFLVLEIFFWTKPLGLKVFRMSLQKAQESRLLAMNQGLYNGFLSAGLFFSLFSKSLQIVVAFQWFFLICVIIAGIFGAATVSKKIFFIQALPAILAILCLIYNF